MKDQPALPAKSDVTPKPLEAADRLVTLDILRGLALFGVMAINVVFDFRVSIFEQFLPPHEFLSPLDAAIARFLDDAISLKAFALFSLLFGAGLAIQFDRLPKQRRAVLLVRRLLVLFGFGLVHLVLIWNGDILTEYALAGLVVLPLLYGPRWLLAVGALALLILYSTSYLVRLMPPPDARSMAEHVREARAIYANGDFLDILKFRVREISAIGPLHVWVFPRTLALFLTGALVWRTSVLHRASESRWLIFGVTLAAGVATLWVNRALASVTLAVAYGAFAIAVASTKAGLTCLGWAAPLGRMAFTNYIAQSLIFGFTFYGYGFGLFGRLDVATALAFGVAVYVAQVIVSRWWLARYRFGAIEWLWRSLMYGRLPPMKLPVVT